MSQLSNDALLQILGTNGFSLGDDLYFFAGAPTTQAGGAAFRSEIHRVVSNAVSGAGLVLKSLLTNDANLLTFLINDSANPINVFPFKGELMNGVLNAAFSVTAGNSAIFVGIPPAIARKGGSVAGGTLNWTSALIL